MVDCLLVLIILNIYVRLFEIFQILEGLLVADLVFARLAGLRD